MPLTLLGVRVLQCVDLGQESVYIPRQRILVVDADLTEERCEEISCEALGIAVARMGQEQPEDVESRERVRLARLGPIKARCEACGTVRTVSPRRIRVGADETTVSRPYRCQGSCGSITPHELDRNALAARGRT